MDGKRKRKNPWKKPMHDISSIIFVWKYGIRDITLITAGGAPKTLGGGSQNFTTLF